LPHFVKVKLHNQRLLRQELASASSARESERERNQREKDFEKRLVFSREWKTRWDRSSVRG